MNIKIGKHRATYDLGKLQASLRRSDTIWGNTTVLRAESQDDEDYTISEHDSDAQPLGKLTLITLDDNGNGTPPDGTALVVRGEAWVSGMKTKIGVCR